MFMFGTQPESSSPVIAFISKSSRQRNYAKALLKDSKLLKDHPSIRIKMLNKEPALPQTKVFNSKEVLEESDENVVYLIGDTHRLCGAQIAIGQSRFATMGGVMLIDQKYYGITAQHVRSELAIEDDDFDDSEPSCFDEDSDDEHVDAVQITSKGSISSYNMADSITEPSYTSESERVSDLSFTSVDTLAPEPQRLDDEQYLKRATPNPIDAPESLSRIRISSLSAQYVKSSLDYELFELEDPALFGQNAINVTMQDGERPARLAPTHIVQRPAERAIWACSGRDGPIRGTMLEASHYIKMKYSSVFQEMWVVRLEKQTVSGDCGSWVIDATNGDLYGHIVAGDSVTGLGYIIPAYAIADDIEKRFGVRPLLPSQISVFEKAQTVRSSIKTVVDALDEIQDQKEGNDLQRIEENNNLPSSTCRQEAQPIIHNSRQSRLQNPPRSRNITNRTNEVEQVWDIETLRRETFKIIDRAPFQKWVIFVASAGVLTDVYDTFAVNTVLRMWENDPQIPTGQGAAPIIVSSGYTLLICVTFLGSTLGQLLFGILGDFFGRRNTYGLIFLTILAATIGFVSAADKMNGNMEITGWFLFWRFIMGLGIGGDYPLSAAITSEFAPTKHRPAMLATLFFRQPVGQFIATVTPVIGTSLYKSRIEIVNGYLSAWSLYDTHYPPVVYFKTVDPAWRWIVGFGVIPAIIAFILRLQIPESPRYTMDVLSDAKRAFDETTEYFEAAGIMERQTVPRVESDKNKMSTVTDINVFRYKPIRTFSDGKEFTSTSTLLKDDKYERPNHFRHWRLGFNQYFFTEGNWVHLATVAVWWFLVHLSFYGLGMNSPYIVQEALKVSTPGDKDHVWDRLWKTASYFPIIVVTVSTLLGGFLITYEVRRNRLLRTQSGVFVVLGTLPLITGSITNCFPLSDPKGHWASLIFNFCYYLLFNLGANATTFMILSKQFPTQYRCTFIGLAVATGNFASVIAQATLDRHLIQATDATSQDISNSHKLFNPLIAVGFFMLLGAIVTLIWIPDSRDADGDSMSLEDLARGRKYMTTLRKKGQ